MEKKRKKQQENFYPVAMTIAGSDSGGGAGIQADLRTFNAFGVYGCSAITAVTSQNPVEITRIDTLSPEAVTAQIDAVVSETSVTTVKSGMLFSAGNVDAVAEAVKKYQLKLICDPILISSGGKVLLETDAVGLFKSKLMKLAAWLTPNIPEAEFLLDRKISSTAEQIEAAGMLHELSGAAILLKGGHAEKNPRQQLSKVDDVICYDGKIWIASSLRVDHPQYASHGTGCTLSAAMTAAFALGMPWQDAICAAKGFVMGSLVENVRIGNRISAMYPPGNDYSGSIRLEEMDVK